VWAAIVPLVVMVTVIQFDGDQLALKLSKHI